MSPPRSAGDNIRDGFYKRGTININRGFELCTEADVVSRFLFAKLDVPTGDTIADRVARYCGGGARLRFQPSVRARVAPALSTSIEFPIGPRYRPGQMDRPIAI